MATNTHAIHHFHIAYNTPCLPPSSSISLGDDCNTQKNLKTMVIRCEFFRGQTMYIMRNVKMLNNNSVFLLNPNHSMFTNLASRVSPFSPRGAAKGGRKARLRKKANVKLYHQIDPVFASIVVYCLLLLLKNK